MGHGDSSSVSRLAPARFRSLHIKLIGMGMAGHPCMHRNLLARSRSLHGGFVAAIAGKQKGLRLLPKAQAGDNCPIAINICSIQVREVAPALSNQLKETAARMVILLVDPQVLRKLVDTPGQDCDLNL